MSDQMVDKNGIRGGAAISAVVLLLAWVILYENTAGSAIAIGAVSVALGIGSVFGPRRSPLGSIYRTIKRASRLRIGVELEPEAPPRFAQTLGFIFTAAGTVFVTAGLEPIGWALALMVAGLQGLLAATGICIGCEMYLIGKRLSARGA